MTENEKLRALLAEARAVVGDYECIDCGIGSQALWGRIDAALAEPVVGCVECSDLRALLDRQSEIISEMNTPAEERVSALEMEVAVSRNEIERLTTENRRVWREGRAMTENEKLRALVAAALAEPVTVYANDGLPTDEPADAYVNGLWEGMFTAQKQRDEARAHLAAVEKLLPREEYLSDKTLAENFAGYIEGLKHAHTEAVAAFHDATRLRSIIQQARIKAEDERNEARAEVERLKEAVIESRRAHAAGPDVALGNDARLANATRAAFQRGAEAMREAAAQFVEEGRLEGHLSLAHWTAMHIADGVRALPIPEEEP